MGEAAGATVDVWPEGEPVQRDVTVEVTGDGLRLGERLISHSSIFWTSRRSGLLMVFARDDAVAIKAPSGRLERLADQLEPRIHAPGGRLRLPTAVTREVVLLTAGVAVVGELGGSRTKGLRLAVFTREALHLMAGRTHLRLPWPADLVKVKEVAGGGGNARSLDLARGESRIRILYLFPEELERAAAIARSAEGDPSADWADPVVEGAWEPAELTEAPRTSEDPGEDESGRGAPEPSAGPRGEPRATPDATGEDRREETGQGDPVPSGEPRGVPEASEEGPREAEVDPGPEADEPPRDPPPREDEDWPSPPGEGESLEMFARGEVAPPVRAELPALHRAADALPGAAREAAQRLGGKAAERAELGPHFFETHLLELGEISLGPLLLRKSAASSASELVRAVEAMDAGELQEDARAAVANASTRLLEVYHRELDRLLSARRAPSRLESEYAVGTRRAEEIRSRMQAPFEELAPLFRELEERQAELLRRIRQVEEAPPDTEQEEMDRALEEWSRTLRRVDLAFESAWRELAGRLTETWREELLPRLEEVGSMRRRRVPEWVRLALLGTVVLLVIAAAMIFVVW